MTADPDGSTTPDSGAEALDGWRMLLAEADRLRGSGQASSLPADWSPEPLPTWAAGLIAAALDPDMALPRAAAGTIGLGIGSGRAGLPFPDLPRF